jgi:hypothetical protein
MAHELSLQINLFKPQTCLLGCIAHVIDLAAKAGILALGTMEDKMAGKEILTTKMGDEHLPLVKQMNLAFVTLEPDGAGINANTILKRVHSLATYVCILGQPLGTPNFYFTYTKILVCTSVYTNNIGVRP